MSTAMALRLPNLVLPGSARTAASALTAAAMLAGVWLLFTTGGTEVGRIQVEGQFRHLSADEIVAAVRPLAGGPFAELDLEAVRAAVERLPWVAHARVERQWPGAMRVRAWEREAYARWGENSLLDTEARVFTPAAADLSPELPLLHAPAAREREAMEAFSELSEGLAGTEFALSELRLDPRSEWFARTVTGIELRLGRGKPAEKLDLIRGVLLESLRERMGQVDYLDLRYANGFAVGWKPEPAAEPAAEQKGGASNG